MNRCVTLVADVLPIQVPVRSPVLKLDYVVLNQHSWFTTAPAHAQDAALPVRAVERRTSARPDFIRNSVDTNLRIPLKQRQPRLLRISYLLPILAPLDR